MLRNTNWRGIGVLSQVACYIRIAQYNTSSQLR